MSRSFSGSLFFLKSKGVWHGFLDLSACGLLAVVCNVVLAIRAPFVTFRGSVMCKKPDACLQEVEEYNLRLKLKVICSAIGKRCGGVEESSSADRGLQIAHRG